MKYSRFEILVLAVGVAAVIGSLFFSVGTAPVLEEVIAQFLLLGVLVGAVHWGRKGGFLAATAASLIYIVMRLPLVMQQEGLSTEVAVSYSFSSSHTALLESWAVSCVVASSTSS